MKEILLGIVVSVISFLTVTSISSAAVVARADKWCPYNCDPGNKPGYLVELLKKALGDVD